MRVCPRCGAQYAVAEGFCPMDGTALQLPDPASEPIPPEAKPLLGRVLDRRYRLDELIGQGGMAFVFRATHTLIGKRLAIKVLRPEHMTDPRIVERFLREARLSSQLKHPNIVDISDFGSLPEGWAFYVMELLAGQTLAAYIRERGSLHPGEAVEIAVQIAAGLAVAHAKGIVHRDLKPENVFLATRRDSERPRVKLLDFGVARAGDLRVTAAGVVLGTPEYMPPEQATGSDVDARADLYALGVIVYEMLTGRVPFQSDDVAEVLSGHIHRHPPSFAEVAPNVRSLPRLEHAVFRFLEKRAEERPPSAQAAISLLTEALAVDVSTEEAARVERATLPIGSGGVGAEIPMSDWSHGVPASALGPGPHGFAGHQDARPEPEPEPRQPEPPASPPVRGRPSVPLVMGITALSAGTASFLLFWAMGALDVRSPPEPARPAEVDVGAAIVHPASTPRALPASAPLPADPPKAPEPSPTGAIAHDSEHAPPETMDAAKRTEVDTKARGRKSTSSSKRRDGTTPARKPERPPDPPPPSTPPPSPPTAQPSPQKPAPPPNTPPPKPVGAGDLKDPFASN